MPESAQRQAQTQSSHPVRTAPQNRTLVPQPACAENPLLAQQQALGNQAVQRLLSAGVIQAKLKIGLPEDRYEQEDDRVAEQVMRMTAPETTPTVDEHAHEQCVQRCAACDDETVSEGPMCSACAAAQDKEQLHAKEMHGATPSGIPGVGSQIH